MKRGSGRLVRQTDKHKTDAADAQDQVVVGQMRQARRDVGQHNRAGAAIEQRHPVEEEARGKAADEQVFHGRLLARFPLPEEPGEHVEGERQQLDADEECEQAGGCDGHHHSRQRGQEEDVELALVEATVRQVGRRQHQHQESQQQEHDLEEERIVVDRNGAVEGGETALRQDARSVDREGEGDDNSAGGERRQPGLALATEDRIGRQHDDAGDGHNGKRRESSLLRRHQLAPSVRARAMTLGAISDISA